MYIYIYANSILSNIIIVLFLLSYYYTILHDTISFLYSVKHEGAGKHGPIHKKPVQYQGGALFGVTKTRPR